MNIISLIKYNKILKHIKIINKSMTCKKLILLELIKIFPEGQLFIILNEKLFVVLIDGVFYDSEGEVTISNDSLLEEVEISI